MFNFFGEIFNPNLISGMFFNAVGFIYWLLIFSKNVAYTYLVVLPVNLFKFLINQVLSPLSPVFASCSSNGCVLNDAGKAAALSLLLLALVGLLRLQGKRQTVGK